MIVHIAKPPAGEHTDGVPTGEYRFSLPVEYRGRPLGVDVAPVPGKQAPAPEPAPAPVRMKKEWRSTPAGLVSVEVPDLTPREQALADGMRALHRGPQPFNFGPTVWGPSGAPAGFDQVFGTPITREYVDAARNMPQAAAVKVAPLMQSAGFALLDEILMDVGVVDDFRVASVKDQVAAEAWLRDELAKLPHPGDPFSEESFGWRKGAVALILIEFRDRGGDPERGALIAGQECPVRLWRKSCTQPDEAAARAAEEAEERARSEAAHARIAAIQASPNKRTCADRGVVETHVTPGMFPPAWVEGRNPDHVMTDGTRVWIDHAFAGLVAPASPPYTVLQGEDVSPISYALASKPLRRATDEDYFRLVRRLAIDTSPRPAWRPLNSATRHMLDGRMDGLLRATGALLMHEREIVARGCLVRPDVAARRELDALRDKLLEEENKRQEGYPAQWKEDSETRAANAERQLAGKYESLVADYQRAAGPGRIAWGSCIVTITDVAGDAARGMFDGVKALLSSRVEPVTSAELAEALGCAEDDRTLAAAAEGAGWKRVRRLIAGERTRQWVPVGKGGA
jgi:hypothetical protein